MMLFHSWFWGGWIGVDFGSTYKALSISRQPPTSAKVLERRGHWSIRKVKSLVFPVGKYEASRFYEPTPSACSACAAWPVGFSSCLAFFQLCECMRRALNALKPIGPDQRRTFEEFWFWLLRLCLRHCYGIQRTLKCASMCCGFQGVPLVVSHRRRARRGHGWGSKVWPLSVFIIATFRLNRCSKSVAVV